MPDADITNPGSSSIRSKAQTAFAASAVLLSFIVSSGPARADDPLPGMMPKEQIPDTLKNVTAKTDVGSWVEYSIRQEGSKMGYRWRIALVGKEGKGLYWWEYLFRWGRLRSLVVKVLMEGKKHDPTNFKRVIWKPGGHQAIELPMKKGIKLLQFYSRSKYKTKLMGSRMLVVAAGKFAAKYYISESRQRTKIHFWTNEGVPIMGLVKFLSPTMRMELIGFGSRAKSMITGKPGRLPGLPGPDAQ